MNKKIVVYIIIVLVLIFGVYYYFIPSTKSPYQNVPSPLSEAPKEVEIKTDFVSPTNDELASSSIIKVNGSSTVNVLPTKIVMPVKTYTISIVNFAFSPKKITLNKGDTIKWTNNDSAPHQIKGDTLGSLSSSALSNSQTYSFTFTESGTFNYSCTIHPSMKGIVTVK